MAKLFAAKRNALPTKDFALPGKRAFPINDKTHAVQALRMKGHASPSEQGEIESKVASKFPGVGGLMKQKTKVSPAKGLAARLTGK